MYLSIDLAIRFSVVLPSPAGPGLASPSSAFGASTKKFCPTAASTRQSSVLECGPKRKHVPKKTGNQEVSFMRCKTYAHLEGLSSYMDLAIYPSIDLSIYLSTLGLLFSTAILWTFHFFFAI